MEIQRLFRGRAKRRSFRLARRGGSLEISALRYAQGGSVVDTWLSFPRKINALIAGLRASRECRAAHWGNDADLSLVVRSKNLDAV
jgi:hypothetical protein